MGNGEAEAGEVEISPAVAGGPVERRQKLIVPDVGCLEERGDTEGEGGEGSRAGNKRGEVPAIEGG